MRYSPWIAVALVPLAACDLLGPGDDGQVAIRFRGSAAPAAAMISGTESGPALAITITGSNGTLTIQSLHMVVAEFELEGSDEACPHHNRGRDEDDEGDDDDEHEDCAEFEAPPFLLSLPLDGSAVTVKTADVPVGTYDELEFEVEDGEVDDDHDEAGEINALRGQMLALFADWPKEASMVVVGTFTPTGGTARPFRTFVDAEVDIELDLDPPLTVGDDGTAEVTVILDPSMWFRNAANRVIDLSAFSGAGRRLQLEVELESGFTKVEIEKH